jgi:hypothetical protein
MIPRFSLFIATQRFYLFPWFFLFFFFFGGTLLLKPHLQPFCSSYWGYRVLVFSQASLNHEPPIFTSHHSWADRCTHPTQLFSIEVESHHPFFPLCLGCPGAMIIQISVSCVAWDDCATIPSYSLRWGHKLFAWGSPEMWSLQYQPPK